MKKIISVLLLVVFALCFGACGEKWTDGSVKITAVAQKEGYQEYLTYIPITYEKEGVSFISQINSVDSYKLLITAYEKTLKQLWGYVDTNKEILSVKPQNVNINEDISSLINNLAKFEKQILVLEQQKTSFERMILLDDFNSEVNKQVLKDFKKQFIVALRKTKTFAEKFDNIINKAYFAKLSDTSSIYISDINILKQRAAFYLACFSCEYICEYNAEKENSDLNVFANKSDLAKAELGNSITVNYENYLAYYDYVDLLKNQLANFQNALKNIDLAECESNYVVYFMNNANAETSYRVIDYSKTMAIKPN